jgi:hypothetical protein
MVLRKNYVLAIETRKNLFVLAQFIGNGTLVFFNNFKNNINEFDNIDLSKVNILCCVTAIKHFFRETNIIKLNVKPRTDIENYNENNHLAYGVNFIWEKKIIYKGTKDEMEVLYRECDLRLVNWKLETIKVLNIRADRKIIENNQVDMMGVNWELNERLYLSYKYGKYIEPMKDLTIGKRIPIEYKTYYKLIMGKMTDDEYKKL